MRQGRTLGGHPLICWLSALLLAACATAESAPPNRVARKAIYIPEVFALRTPRALPAAASDPASKPAPADSDIVDRALDEYEMEGLIRLARKAESLRGLAFRSLPEVRVQNRKGIQAAYAADSEPEQRKLTALRYRLLGLLSAGEDLQNDLQDDAAERVLGYYHPKSKRLVLRDDVARVLRFRLNADPDSTGAILHELVHALQDQHFDLEGGRLKAGTEDARSAYAALVEGDATLAVIKHAAGYYGVTFESLIADPQTLDTLVLSRLRPAPSVHGPPALHGTISFRYGAGAAFVASLLRSGGQAALDRAFHKPPASSSEILDPERFHASLRADRLSAFALPLLEKAGAEVVEQQVLGEIVTNAFLASSGQNADGIASSWRGDRFLLLRFKEGHGYLWVLAFPGVAEAGGAYELAQKGAARQTGKRRVVHVQQRNRFVLITGNVPKTLRARLDAQFAAWADRRE